MEKLIVLFYENANGKKPVKEWLHSLSKNDRKIIGEDIKTIEYGFPIGMPTCRKLENKLYEIRSNISDKRITRVIFVVINKYIILLNGFIKKSQKTPKNEIILAKQRAKEIK